MFITIRDLNVFFCTSFYPIKGKIHVKLNSVTLWQANNTAQLKKTTKIYIVTASYKYFFLSCWVSCLIIFLYSINISCNAASWGTYYYIHNNNSSSKTRKKGTRCVVHANWPVYERRRHYFFCHWTRYLLHCIADVDIFSFLNLSVCKRRVHNMNEGKGKLL